MEMAQRNQISETDQGVSKGRSVQNVPWELGGCLHAISLTLEVTWPSAGGCREVSSSRQAPPRPHAGIPTPGSLPAMAFLLTTCKRLQDRLCNSRNGWGTPRQVAPTCSESQCESVWGLGPGPPPSPTPCCCLAPPLQPWLLPCLPVCSTPSTSICLAGLITLALLFGSAHFNIDIDYSYIKEAQKYQGRTKAIIIMRP